MQHKTFDLLEIKADGQQGEFTALASVFNNVDLGGDRMLPGSFKNTLEKWRSTGDPIPVVLSHQWDDPMAYVGKADPRAVYETDEGLVVQGQLDTSTDVGAQVYKLMKDRLLKGWSFGYTVPKGGQKRQKDGTNDVSEVDLVEVGPTLKGMNPEAQLQAIKSALPEAQAKELEAAVEDKSAEEADNSLREGLKDLELDLMASGVHMDGEPDPPTEEKKPAEVLAEFEEQGWVERQGKVWVVNAEFVKAAWSAAYVNNLPDSAFLHIESGGSKDSEGKTTPRSLRHFPVKDDTGAVDLAHLRNALARIPQSSLSQSVKDRLTATAQRMLDDMKSIAIEDAADEEPAKAKSQAQDPLSQTHDELAFELTTAGIDVAEPPQVKKEEPKPEPSLADLEQQFHDLMLETLT